MALAEALQSYGVSYAFQTYTGVGHTTYDLGETATRRRGDFFKKVFALSDNSC